MRLRTNIFALLFMLAGLLPAAEWTTESAGFEFDTSLGRGKLHGPVLLKFGGWSFSCSREALVSAKGTIVKTTGADGVSAYDLRNDPARVVFLGGARVADKDGKIFLQAPFLILSMENMSVMAKGAGISVSDGSRKIVSLAEEATVLIDLKTGLVSRSGTGW